MKTIQALAFVYAATTTLACSGTDQEAAQVDDELRTAQVIEIHTAELQTNGGSDVVRVAPSGRITVRNTTAKAQRLLLADANVISEGAAEYAKAIKIDVPAGASVTLGGATHPLERGATFVGFDDASLASPGFHRFAKFTVWVGRSVNRQCDFTTAKLGTDACPAWGLDADMCTCTPAFGGGG